MNKKIKKISITILILSISLLVLSELLMPRGIDWKEPLYFYVIELVIGLIFAIIFTSLIYLVIGKQINDKKKNLIWWFGICLSIVAFVILIYYILKGGGRDDILGIIPKDNLTSFIGKFLDKFRYKDIATLVAQKHKLFFLLSGLLSHISALFFFTGMKREKSNRGHTIPTFLNEEN